MSGAGPVDAGTRAAGVGFVLVYHTAVVAAAQSAPVLAPFAAGDLGLDARDVGLFTALVFATALVSSNGLAGFMTRYGSFASAAASLGLAGAGVAAVALATGALGIVVGALLIGVAYGPVNPVGSRVLARVASGPRQNLIFSLKQSSVAIGAAVAGAALPALALAVGWRDGALCVAAACVATAAVAIPARARLGDDADQHAGIRFVGPVGPAAAMLADPSRRGLTLAVFAFSMAQFGFMSVYVTMIWRETALPPESAGAMLALAMGSSVAGRLFWGWRADVSRPRRVLVGLAWSGALLLTVLLTLGPAWPSLAVAAASLALGFGPLSWSGVLLSEVARAGAASDGQRGVLAATAGTMVFAYLGGLVGPALLSLSAALSGSYEPGIALMAAGFAASAVILGRETPRRPRRAREDIG